MVSNLLHGGYKNQLTVKYERKFSVFNIFHIKFIIYIEKFTTVNIFELNFLLGNMNDSWHV